MSINVNVPIIRQSKSLDTVISRHHPSYITLNPSSINSVKICPNHAQIWFKFGKSHGEYGDSLLQTARKVWTIWYKRTPKKIQPIWQNFDFWAFSVGFRMVFGDQVHFHALGAHTSTTQTTDISRSPCLFQFFPLLTGPQKCDLGSVLTGFLPSFPSQIGVSGNRKPPFGPSRIGLPGECFSG